MGQRIWLFPVWLTAVRINRRQDLTSRYFHVIYVATRKCLCCVSVYMNECNSFDNVLKYQYITDTFVFLGGAYIKCFPVITLIGCNIKCYRGRIQFYK